MIMPASPQDKVKLAVLEEKFNEIHKHTMIMNTEFGELRDNVANLALQVNTIEQNLKSIRREVRSNTSLTKMVLGGVLVTLAVELFLKMT